MATAREILMLHEESSYGTPALTAGAPTTARHVYIRLQENGFSMDDEPMRYEIPYGGGHDVLAETGSDQLDVKGTLRTPLYYAQADFLLRWATTRINEARTAPFVTTDAAKVMPVGDLASMSAYHAIQQDDSTYKRVRYAGCKVESWKISISRESKFAMLDLTIRAQKPVGNAFDASSDPTTTEFPDPAEAAMPTSPVLFTHSAGLLSIVGTARTQYDSLDIMGENRMDPKWFENRFLILHRWLGRRVTMEADLHLKATPDDKASQRAITLGATSVAFNNGVNTLTLTFGANTFIAALPRELPLNRVYKRKLRGASQFVAATLTDFSYTYA